MGRRGFPGRVVEFAAAGTAVQALACGAAPPLPIQGQRGMLDRTAAAQKCEEAAKGHDRPFVVEWDATDLASFEAKAARDTVVVKYKGCELEVLYQCSDAVVAGKLGSYGTPQFTSGTQQSFDIANEGELYAKLPLGAAQLSGRVSAGEQLRLLYYVTGVATASREAVFEGELAKYPGCAGATHFVWGYNLGAFELRTLEHSSIEGSASAGIAEAGGHSKHSQESVGSGGKLASCETQDQRGCRVPIRLVLRPITGGQSPLDAQASPAAASPGTQAPAAASGSQGKDLWDHAKELAEKGDGAGCLAMLDRALGADLRLGDQHDFKFDHAQCEMLAGKCDQGKTDYRAALAAADIKREQSDFQLDRATRDESNEWCPSGTAKDDADFILRADRELQSAAKVADGKTCKSLITGISQHYVAMLKVGINNQPDFDVRSRAEARAGNDYDLAAPCVAASTKKCADGLDVMRLQCSIQQGGMKASCEKAVAASWSKTVADGKIHCK